VEAEKIDHALVEEDRLAVRRQPPEMAGDHVHEMRQFPFSRAQLGLDLLEVLDVDRRAVPAGDVAVGVARRPPGIADPAVDAVRAPQTMLGVVMVAGSQTMAPSGGHALIVVGMNQSSPSE